eukprot:1155224-Pelagomonas_calceolata.AAC.16
MDILCMVGTVEQAKQPNYLAEATPRPSAYVHACSKQPQGNHLHHQTAPEESILTEQSLGSTAALPASVICLCHQGTQTVEHSSNSCFLHRCPTQVCTRNHAQDT